MLFKAESVLLPGIRTVLFREQKLQLKTQRSVPVIRRLFNIVINLGIRIDRKLADLQQLANSSFAMYPDAATGKAVNPTHNLTMIRLPH